MSDYPVYQRVRQGINFITESVWPAAFGGKWGLFLIGAGTAVKDTIHYWGGEGSCHLTTGAVALNQTVVKVNTSNALRGKDIIAFEHKFMPVIAFGDQHWVFGIQDRKNVDPFFAGAIRYTVTGDVLEYESAPGVYTPFPENAVIERPTISAANGPGDIWGWVRLVVDFDKNEYVSLEYNDATKGYTKLNMKGIPLPSITAGNTVTSITVFAGGDTPVTTATDYYTTDWIISRLASSDI